MTQEWDLEGLKLPFKDVFIIKINLKGRGGMKLDAFVYQFHLND